MNNQKFIVKYVNIKQNHFKISVTLIFFRNFNFSDFYRSYGAITKLASFQCLLVLKRVITKEAVSLVCNASHGVNINKI